MLKNTGIKFQTHTGDDTVSVHLKFFDHGRIYNDIPWIISKAEYQRFLKERTMPLRSPYGSMVYANKNGFYHNEKGPAVITKASKGSSYQVSSYSTYYINGVYCQKKEWEQKTTRRVIFSRKNKNTLKKLLYIPELFQNVFYDNKGTFISLIRKV